MVWRLALLMLMVAAIAGNAYADQLRAVEALRAETPITVNGVLSEACWERGRWYEDFSVLDAPHQQAQVQTRFKVLHDDAYLYFGLVMDEPSVQDMRATVTERDGRVHSDDCVEIMLDPTGERAEYYHFIINSRGTIYDAQMRQGGNVRSVEWDAGVEAAAAVGEDSWTAEVRIPMVELGLTAASVEQWALNVARARYADGVEFSSFSPLTGGFHQPSLYATLTLADADLGRYLWEIRNPYEERVMPDEDGQLMYRAKTHVRNAGPSFRFIMLRGLLEDSAGQWVRDGLDAGQSREYEISVPVVAQGRQNLVLQLLDRAEEMPLALRTLPMEITYSPLHLTILRPWYRDSIYATETVEEIVGKVVAAVSEAELNGLQMVAQLAPEGEPDAAPLGRAQGPAEPEMTVRMAIPGDMEIGDYSLQITLVDDAGQAQHSVARRIRKLPAVEHEWRVDERNALLYNGEPVLPFGWFGIPTSAMAESGHAYTAMQAYNSQYYSVERVRSDLDTVAEAGTAVAIYPYPNPGMMDAEAWGRPLSDEEAEALRLRVRALKNHPGLLAWYIADEPELRPALPERIRRIYEVIADEDPFHPCIMLNDSIAGIYKYVEGGDILMPDPYPLFIKDGLAARPLEITSQFIKAAVDASDGRRAIWVTPQAFNYGDYGRHNNRAPTLTELRNQFYQAVVYGAKGALWYTYGHKGNYPHLGLGMPWLSFEVADLKDFILQNPAEDVAVAVEAEQPEHIHVCARRANGHLTIFAVSTATRPQDVRFSINPAPGSPSMHVVSEARNVSLQNGMVIEDHFDTYATHIYTTHDRVGQRADIADVMQAIQQAEASRKKPGNLAFEDHGTVVQVSSKSRYGSFPDRVVDGVEDGMAWQSEAHSLPQWLVVRWPEPATIGRAVVFTPNLADFQVQVLEDEQWVTVAEVAGNADRRVEVTFDTQVETVALRVFITGLVEGADQARIWEVEAYAQ